MGRGARIGAWLAGGVVVVLALIQVLLPRIAASRISSRVGRYGTVQSVSVTAWPAVELLWEHADSVHVKAKSISLTPSQAAKLLAEARGTGDMDVSAEHVQVGSLRLSSASLRKRGSALVAQADVTEADAMAALPSGLSVRLLRSEHGEVEVRASGALFGVGASVNAIAAASGGDLIAHPVGFLVEGLKLTLFSDPRVHVEGVGASALGGSPPSYRLTMAAKLR
jgi:LmeA-like phospholipid-binding